MWRKNRAPNGYHYRPSSNCIGVDLNRNFGYHWMGKEHLIRNLFKNLIV